MNDSKDKPKPRRRWFQFSLRTLLIVVTLSAGVLGWVGWKMEQGRRQRVVIVWLEKMEAEGWGFVSEEDKSWWKQRVDQCFGPSVVAVDLSNSKVRDLTPLLGMKNLETLRLDGTQVTDLSPLAELKSLKCVWLHDTPVSAEQLQKLQQALPNCNIIHPSIERR